MKLQQILSMEDPNELIMNLDTYICEKCEYGENMSALTEAEKLFFLCQELEREVNNGGFHQYLWNSSGNHASEVVGALKAIGADATAEIVKQALAVFPNAIAPSDIDERQAILDGIDVEAFSDLEDKFYAYPDDLTALNYNFVKEHQAEFH